MDKFKKSLSFVLISLLAFTGFLFGCAGKYDNMKLVSSADGQGEIVLYVPQDGNQIEQEDSFAVITYTVTGVGNDVSRDIILPASDEYIDVSDIQKNGDSTSVKITAKKGMVSAHDFVATTKEGGAKNTIKIRCEKRITEMSLTDVSFAITNKVGQTLQLNSAEILSFMPQDATQKDVVFSTTANGVTLTQEGLLTIDEKLNISDIPVTITSKYNSGLSVQTSIKVVTELEKDDVIISTIKNDVVTEQDAIEIMSNVQENSMQHIKVQIANRTDLSFEVKFSVDGNVAKISDPATVKAYVDGNNSNAEATLSAYDVSSDGGCKLYISISLADYKGVEPLVIERDVVVSRIAKRMQIMANNIAHTSNFELDLNTMYANEQNGLPILVRFLDNPNDSRFFVAVEGELEIVDELKNTINFAQYSSDGIYQSLDNISVLQGGQSIYVRGVSAESAKLAIYACGSNDGTRYLTSLLIDCDTYIATELLEVNTTKVVDEQQNVVKTENTIFVEVGKSVTLSYTQNDELGYKTDGGSAKNIKFAIQSISASLERYIDVVCQNNDSDSPSITITGKIANSKNQYIYAYLELPNFVKSQVFKIFVFQSVSSVVVNVDDKQTVLKNVEYGDHAYAGINPSLSYMAIKLSNQSVGTYVDLDVSTYTSNSIACEPYNISYLPTEKTNKLYFDSANKSRLYATDYSEDQNLEISIEVLTLSTANDGSILLKKIAVDDINVQVIKSLNANDVSLDFILDNLEITKNTQTIYWADQFPAGYSKDTELLIGLKIDENLLDYVTWINESDYLVGNNVDNNKTRYLVKALYENYGLSTGVDYDQIPQVINCRVGVQVSYFGQIVTKYLNIELKKPVLPAYIRLEDLSSERTYTISTIGASGYEVNITDLTQQYTKLYAKLYANDGSDTVTDKNIVWKNKYTNEVYASTTNDYGYSVCELSNISGKLVLTLVAEHNENLTKEVIVYKRDGQDQSNAKQIANSDDLQQALISQSSLYYQIDADDLELDASTVVSASFSGHIDGNGKIIKIKNAKSYLFETIENSASISNITFVIQSDAINATETMYFASVAKENYGTLTGVVVEFENKVEISNQTGLIYFGGLVNLNYGVIENSKVVANSGVEINSKSYVGGIVTENGSNGQLDDVIFEGNLSVIGTDGDDYALGGIAGSNSGTISYAQVFVKEKISGVKYVGGVVGKMDNGTIQGSFVRGQDNYAKVEGNTYVGGLVAFAQSSQIEKCFAKVEVVADADNGIAGGLFAELENTKINYAYIFGTVSAKTQAIISAKASNNTFINQVYAIVNTEEEIAIPFVAGELSYVLVTDCARLVVKNEEQDNQNHIFTEEQLKDIATFENLGWNIGSNSTIWRIDNTRNDGYPVLIYKDVVLDDGVVETFEISLKPNDLGAKEIYAVKKQDDNNQLTKIIKLPFGSYNLIDVLQFEINGSKLGQTSYDRVYVSASKDIGNITKTSQKLSGNLQIESSYSTVVEIAFECKENSNLSQTIIFAFAREYGNLNGEVTLKTSAQNVSFAYQTDTNGSISKTKEFANDIYIVMNNLPQNATFDYQQMQVEGQKYYYANSALILRPNNQNQTSNETIYFDLYQLIDGIYVKINDQTANLAISYIAELATQLLADTDKLSITPSSDQEIVVYVYTLGSEPTVYANFDDASLNDWILVKQIGTAEQITNGYKYTFVVGFDEEKIADLSKINYTILENIQLNGNIVFEVDGLSKQVAVDASLQTVSNLEANTFPVEREGNNAYISANVKANLTAGEMALLDLNLYPQVSAYNRIEVTSSVNSDGIRFGFIQLVKNAENKYLEAKPNAISVQNGVKLYRISELDINNSVSFNGHLYLACILNGTLDADATFNITIKVYLSQDDASPITKVISLKVLATPEVALQFATNQTTGQTASDELEFEPFAENDGREVSSYYMVARGLSVDLTQILSFIPAKLDYQIKARQFDEANSEFVELSQEEIYDYFRLTNQNDNWKLYALSNAKQGMMVAIKLSAQKSIVGNMLTHTYESNWIYFYVVDFIIKDIKIASPTNVVYLNKTTKVQASVNAIYDKDNDEIVSKIADLENQINNIDNQSFGNYYWSDYEKDNGKNGKLESFSYTLLFGPKYDSNSKDVNYGNAGEGIYIYGTRVANDQTTILNVSLNYDYDQQGNFKFGAELEGVSGKFVPTTSQKFEIKESTTISSPLPIYTIDDFYSMTQNVDYILMVDLTFGVNSDYQANADEFATTDIYKPFNFVSNSLDGNSHTITILGDNGNSGFGLFNSISSSSIIKNLNVVYDVLDGDTNTYTIDMENVGTASLGGFAGQNSGVITNCKVTYNANVKIVAKPNSTNDISGAVAGFVSANSGKITYSTVDTKIQNGITISYSTSEKYTYTDDTSKEEVTSNVSVSLNMAGFVNSNTNLISNCQVDGIGLNNVSSEKNKKLTAGFANTNTKNIFASSVEGTFNSGSAYADETKTDTNAILTSKYQIAGFISINSGTIRDSYANIPMSTTQSTSGFVFDNKSRGDGAIETSYTASQYTGLSQTNTHSAFIGADDYSNILNSYEKALVKNCYYFADEQNNNSDGSQYDPAGYLNPQGVTDKDLQGFDIYDSLNDYTFDKNKLRESIPSKIWKCNSPNLPTLAENEYNDAIHNLYVRKITSKIESTSFDDQDILTYSEVDKISGVDIPKQVATALELLEGLKEDNYDYTSIRLVNDIDFSAISNAELLKLSRTKFVGNFDGNSMTISGINVVADDDTNNPFGLFGQIGKGGQKTTIKNLTIKVSAINSSSSVAVGALAGIALNVDAKNIAITSNSGTGTITGKNLVGGVFGLVLGDSTLYNLSADVNVLSQFGKKDDIKIYPNIYYSGSQYDGNLKVEDTDYESYDKFIENLNSIVADCSYAGGIAGVVDVNTINYTQTKDDEIADIESYENLLDTKMQPNATALTVTGNVTIIGAKAGGLLGYMGKNVYMSNASFVVATDSSLQKISGYHTAGGLVAENFAGAIKQSTVSTVAEDAYASDQNLTNVIGENLFADCNNPIYIGGMVGYSHGGAIIHSYSKTNVMNSSAQFAGGLVGGARAVQIKYQTYSDNMYGVEDKSITRPVTLQQVYTTANVFAGVDYNTKDENDNIIYDNDGKVIATPKYFAGGIFGEMTSIDVGDEFAIDGVVGANGFHRPASYTLPTQKDVNGKTATYGDIVAGYSFETQNTAGVKTYTVYGATLGAFAGKVCGDVKINQSSSADRKNLFSQYAYNGVEIRLTDAVNDNGNGLELCANNQDANIPFDQSYRPTSSQFSIDINEDNEGVKFENNGDSVTYEFDKRYSYFVIRGDADKSVTFYNSIEKVNQTKYFNSFAQNSDGIYRGWDKWIYKQPIYPDFMKNDLIYDPIESAEDLISMQSGKRYKLVSDIYLTENWEPLDLYNTTLVSEKRNQGDTGINGSEYYTIYNININSTTKNIVGLFADFDSCQVSNINFVFGTNYADFDGTAYNDTIGVSVQDVSKFGLIAGKATRSTISGCNVYVASDDISVEASKIATGNINIGGLVGESQNTHIISSSLQFANVDQTGTNNKEEKTATKWLSTKNNSSSKIEVDVENESTTIANIGGVVGYLDPSSRLLFNKISDIHFGTISAKIIAENAVANVGGIVGNAGAASIGVTGDRIHAFSGQKIVISDDSESNAANIGGFAGLFGNATIIDNIAIEKISIESKLKLTENSNGQISVGGFAGRLYSSQEKTSQISFNKITVKDISYGISNSKNAGGFIGLANIGHSAGISIKNCQVETLKTRETPVNNDNNIVGVIGENVGGFIGKFEADAAISVQFENNSVKDAIINSANGSVDSSGGGFVGYFKAINAKIENCFVETFEARNANGANGADFVNLGGFAGKIANVNSISNCYVSNLSMTSGLDTTHFAGFVANVQAATLITNCYSQGNISLSGANTDIKYVGGFGGYISANNIQNCLSNVLIVLNIHNDVSASIAGFIGDTNGVINNSISLGAIKDNVVKYQSHNVNIYGFVASTTQNYGNLNYTLSTMWIMGDNVGATTPKSDKVNYSYNVSGAFNQNNNENSRKTYSDIIEEIKQNAKDKNDNVSKYINTLSTSDGSILNPYGYTDSNQTTFDLQDSKYYIAIDEATYTIKSDSGLYYLIADDDKTATTIKLQNSISNSGYLAGLELFADNISGSIISTNAGYIFNCVGTGIVNQNYNDNADYCIAGFVQTNNGLINACGSMAHINAGEFEKIELSEILEKEIAQIYYTKHNNYYVVSQPFVKTEYNTFDNGKNYYTIKNKKFVKLTTMLKLTDLDNCYEFIQADYYILKQSYNASGFVGTNSKIIANSFATNTIYNGDNSKSYYGFVNKNYDGNNDGSIYNSFVGVALELIGGKEFIEQNVYGFSNKTNIDGTPKTIGTIENCYFDKEFDLARVEKDNELNSDSVGTAVSYNDLRNLTSGKVTLLGFNKNEANSYQTNYGYPYSTSFGITSNDRKMSEDYATYNTGKNSENDRYIIHSMDQFASIVNKVGGSELWLKMVASVNASNGSEDAYNYALQNNFDLSNELEHGIYNVTIKVTNGNSVGLINSTKSIKLKNFAVSGKFSESSLRTNAGVVVGNADTLVAENVAAYLITGSYTASNSFGIFAGNVTNATLTNCSVGIQQEGSSNLSVTGAANVGALIGNAKTLTLNNGDSAFNIQLGTNGTLSGTNAGGIVGFTKKLTIIDKENKTLSLNMTSGKLSGTNVGGIVGKIEINNESEQTISVNSNVVINANLSGSPSNSNVGGFVGTLTGSLANDKTIRVSGEMSGKNIGGIAGSASIDQISGIKISTNIVITADATNVGGVVGILEKGKIENCSYSGKIIVQDQNNANAENVGSIAGYMSSGEINNITFTDKISLSGNNVGGVVGYMTGGQISGIEINKNILLIGQNAGGIVGNMQLGQDAENNKTFGKLVSNKITSKIYISASEKFIEEDNQDIGDILTKSMSNSSGSGYSITPNAVVHRKITPWIYFDYGDGGGGGTSYTPKSYEFDSNYGGIVGQMVGAEENIINITGCFVSNAIEMYYPTINDTQNKTILSHNLGGVVGYSKYVEIENENAIVSTGNITIKSGDSYYAKINVGGISGCIEYGTLSNYQLSSGTFSVNGISGGYAKDNISTNNIGGIVGLLQNGAKASNLVSNSILDIVCSDDYAKINIGGIAGSLVEEREIFESSTATALLGENYASAVNYTFKSKNYNTAYVGGLVGYCKTIGEVHGTSEGDIVGQSYSKKQADDGKTDIYDAKSYANSFQNYFEAGGFWVVYSTYTTGWGFSNLSKKAPNELNYQKKSIIMPLAVGGIFGYLENADLGKETDKNTGRYKIEYVAKLSGKIQALLTNSENYKQNRLSESDNISLYGFISNNETVQCHSGSISGYSTVNNYVDGLLDGYFTNPIPTFSKLEDYLNWNWGWIFLMHVSIERVRHLGQKINGSYIPSYKSVIYETVANANESFKNYYLASGNKTNWFVGVDGNDVFNDVGEDTISNINAITKGVQTGDVIAYYSNSNWAASNINTTQNTVFAGVIGPDDKIYNKSYWSVLDNNGSNKGLINGSKFYAIQDWAGKYVGAVGYSASNAITITINYHSKANGGDIYSDEQHVSPKKTVADIKILTNTEIFEKDTSKKWFSKTKYVDVYYTERNQNGECYPAGSVQQFNYTGSMTIDLYSHWTKDDKYSIEVYDANESGNVSNTNPERFEDVNVTSIGTELTELTKAGYKLVNITNMTYTDDKPPALTDVTLGSSYVDLTNGVKAKYIDGVAYIVNDYGERLEESKIYISDSNDYEYANFFLVARMPITYDIVYNQNAQAGETVTITNDGDYKDTYTIENWNNSGGLLLPILASDNYEFAGWKVSDGSEGSWVDYIGDSYLQYITESDGPTEKYGKLVLTAQWTPKVYTITLNDNDGSGGIGYIYYQYNDGYYLEYNGNQVNNKITDDNKITRPTKTGQTFAGYYYDNEEFIDKDGKLKYTNKITGSITVLAHWDATVYTITLNDNGGSGGMSVIYYKYGYGFYDSIECVEGEELTSITIPTREGFTFAGYYASPGNFGDSGEQYVYENGTIITTFDFNTMFSGIGGTGTVWHARWKAVYTITLNLNGLSATGSEYSTQIYCKHNDSKFYSDNECKTEITKINVDGIENFGGYYKDDTQVIDSDGNILTNLTITSDITLYAHSSI